jgi:alkylation response protein AidB-like acyl-CoA dehydrogenase
VLDAAEADTLIVVARTAGDARDIHGLSLFQVPAGAAGIEIRPYRTYDGRSAADVMLHAVEVPAVDAMGVAQQQTRELSLDGGRLGDGLAARR